jgi:AraC family transcriptional activator of pobA
MSANPFEEFYHKVKPGSGLPGQSRTAGQFKVVNVADLMVNRENRPSMSFDRRPFYKISLIRGRSRIEYADREVEVEDLGLWFVTSRVPYRWHPHDLNQTGYVCLFTDEFLLPVKGGIVLDELPIFGQGACPVLTVSEEEYATLGVIFEKMLRESGSGYAYSHELLRAYLLELIYYGQKLRPDLVPLSAPTAAGRLAAQFAELLERQFPLAAPRQQLALRTARDYADALAVHVNHLNRVLKEATGHTTTALLADRLAQEARQLLKQSSWTVAEIADSLGFTDTAHFCHFFKRQTGVAPGDYRTPLAV